MTTPRTTRWLGALVALLVVLIGLLLVGPAQAAVRTVTLTETGPNPPSITIARGDVIRFQNASSVRHTITDVGTNWSFNKPIAAGDAESTPPFAAAGTYRYTDSFTLVAVPRSVDGSIVVTAPAATATPKPTPKPTATRSPSPRPTTQASASPTPTPVPTGSGTAVGPGFGTGGLPSIGPLGPTTGPRPDVAPPVEPSASGAAAAGANISYGDRNGVVQGSPHRYGLPAALAVVGITGIVSLLVRLLLAHPAARRRRTGPAVTVES